MDIVSTGGREIQLKELLNQPLNTARTLQVFISNLYITQGETQVLYGCYKIMSIKDTEGGEITIYNKWPGKVKEVFVSPGTLISPESILYSLEICNLMEIEHLSKQNFQPPKMKVRFNILNKEVDGTSPWKEIKGHRNTKFLVLLQNGKTIEVDFSVMQKQNPLLVRDKTNQVIEYLEKQ